MPAKNDKWRVILINAGVAAALASLVCALYIWTLNYPFLWDDKYLVLNNPFIRDLANLRHLVTKKYFMQDIELSYRPLGTLTLFINYAIGNYNTQPYRVTMIILHTLNSFLVYRFCVTLRTHLSEPEPGFDWRAFAAAAIFAVHPVCTEAILGVTFVEDPLCLTFMLMGIMSYAKWRSGRSGIFLALSALCMALGVLTKETGVVLPAMIFMWDVLYRKTKSSRFSFFSTAGALVPFALVALGYLALRFHYMTNPIEHISGRDHSGLATMLLSVRAFVHYVSLSVLPIRQCVDYFYTGPRPALDVPHFRYALIFAAAFLILPLALIRRNKAASFALIWFTVFLLPVSNIIPMTVIMAERYLYISLAGFLAAAAMLVPAPRMNSKDGNSTKFASVPAIVWFGVFSAIAGAMFYAACQRNLVWSSDVAFWKNACECAPDSPYSQVNLGAAYFDSGQLADAEFALKKGIAIAILTDPKNDRYGNLYRAYGNLGVTYLREGRLKEAQTSLRNSLAIKPEYPNAHFNMSAVLDRLGGRGSLEAAAREIEIGLPGAPTNVRARQTLVSLYERAGNYSAAAAQLRKLSDIDSENRGEYLGRASQLEKKFTGKSH